MDKEETDVRERLLEDSEARALGREELILRGNENPTAEEESVVGALLQIRGSKTPEEIAADLRKQYPPRDPIIGPDGQSYTFEGLSEETANEMKAAFEMYAKDQRHRQNEVVGRYIYAKAMDVVAILLVFVCIAVVAYLVSESLFEGFIAFIAAVFFLRFVFQRRVLDLFSWFN